MSTPESTPRPLIEFVAGNGDHRDPAKWPQAADAPAAAAPGDATAAPAPAPAPALKPPAKPAPPALDAPPVEVGKS